MENIKYKTAINIIKEWFLNSPSHGIRRIDRAETFITRLFWWYIFWLFIVLMSTFISIVITNYIAHPTKMHLSIRQYRDPEHFPAITFCNINPLLNDKFFKDEKKPKLPGSKPMGHVTEAEDRKVFYAYVNRIFADSVNKQAYPYIEWGFQLNELLITCIFNKRLCYRNLTQMFHPRYGNCYTFDDTYNVEEKETNNIPHDWSVDDDNGDNNYKLFLELYLHQRYYIQYLERRAAFLIFIHRKHEVPMLSQNGVFLRPNKYTKLSFSQRIVRFSQQCRNELTDHMKQIFRIGEIRYTQQLCYKLCEQHFILERCQCIETQLAAFYQFFNKNYDINNTQTMNISVCSHDDDCLAVRNEFNSTELCQECLPECENIQYSVQSSYANYPNTNPNSKKTVAQRVRNYFNKLDIHMGREFHDNIVAVEISASPYATEILTESSVYTWVDLISSIGGQTGLWIGVSLISFFEIIELLYLLINRFYAYLFSL